MSEGAEPTIRDNVERVRERMAAACGRAGRRPEEVTLIAVTKTFGPGAVLDAWAAGVRDFGENYVQEGVAKVAAVRAVVGDGPRFHFIGHLQRNKVREAVKTFAILQSIDSSRLLAAVAAAAPPGGVQVMVQVNPGGEATKGGVTPGELGPLLDEARAMDGVVVTGLMAIPPAVDDAEQARPYFRELATLGRAYGLQALSMGMTDDFEVAIEEGATHVRVGRAIFGARQ